MAIFLKTRTSLDVGRHIVDNQKCWFTKNKNTFYVISHLSDPEEIAKFFFLTKKKKT